MNITRVTAASKVLLAAQKQGTHLAAGWAMALESAGMLRSPGTADLLAEGYPGELAALRGTLAAIRTAVQHGGTPTVADIVAEHYADERAAYAAAGQTEKDTPAGATSTPLTVYRAGYQHELIPLGWYTTAAAARAHCEDTVSQEHPTDVALLFDWLGDDEDALEPRELVLSIDGKETPTGYVVTALEVDTVYDPGGDL